MTLNEIVDQMTAGVWTTIKWSAISGGGYFGILLGCQIFCGWPFRKKIESRKELETVLQEEAEKLGLDLSSIDLDYSKKNIGCKKNGERYTLYLEDSWLFTRNVIKHEFYHILKDCDKGNPTLFRYLFLAEPRATLYGLFGIRL